MILDIVTYPAPSLAEKCAPVTEMTEEIRQLAADMTETMYDAPGVGIAAPQVGRNIRLIVVDPYWSKETPRNPRVLVNPVLTLLGEQVTSEQEGCLSVPLNFRADVKRAERVRLQATDLDGNVIDEELEGFPAFCLQHECDHLDGVLFIDRIGRLRRVMYDSKVKKWQKRRNAG
ncbi:MAG: peptide deformylase [Desulfovibrionaceae bacterium]|nr:peptide deformylase [Desulfovibrionaceae bacterium]